MGVLAVLFVLVLTSLILASCVKVVINPTTAVAQQPTTTASASDLDAANKEAENVKTAALAYYADQSGWPSQSAVLIAGGYLTGPLRASYQFDAATGLIISATSTGWSGIRWDAQSLKWVASS